MTTFAERLKNAMEQANMSQSALSEQAGASKAAISQYLSGKNTVSRPLPMQPAFPLIT